MLYEGLPLAGGRSQNGYGRAMMVLRSGHVGGDVGGGVDVKSKQQLDDADKRMKVKMQDGDCEDELMHEAGDG